MQLARETLGEGLKLLRITLAVCVVLLSSVSAYSQEPVDTFTRKNTSSAAAVSDLEALSNALQKMKAMGCENPLSWYYQGATHSIPTEVKNNNLCSSYQNRADLKWGWDTCTHKNGSKIHFLVWHRIYLAHFEKIVRKLSGKSDFAIPYWNYVDPSSRTMPSSFRSAASSLYSNERLPSLNEGHPIEASMNDNLNVQNLLKTKVYSVFNSSIDRAPHGAMHTYIGGGYADKLMWNSIYQNAEHFGLMTQVQSAAFDPIFWLHHSTIDFIWQSWEQSSNGSRPTLAELKAIPWDYKFYDESGKKVEYTVEQAYEAAFKIDYRYEGLKSAASLALTKSHEALVEKSLAQKKVLLWRKDVSESTTANSMTISPGQLPANKNLELSLTDRPDALVIEIEVSADREPNDAFSVYIMDEAGNRKLTGVMTFFGSSHHAIERSGHPDKIKENFSFDVTSELPADGKYKVIIESQMNKREEVTIESMSLYRY